MTSENTRNFILAIVLAVLIGLDSFYGYGAPQQTRPAARVQAPQVEAPSAIVDLPGDPIIRSLKVGDKVPKSAAGFDDDGGADTPGVAPDLTFTAANSNQFDVSIGGANGQPQIKQAVIKTIVAERIGDLLVRNGYSDESASAVEAAAKAAFNVQTMPPGSIAIAIGALDISGAYRVTQFSIYEDNKYVGAVALAEAGGYGQSPQPSVPEGLFDVTGQEPPAARVQAPRAEAPQGSLNSTIVPVLSEGGTFVVPVTINGQITLQFVIDRGASDVSIPADVVMTLMRTGTISDNDFLGSQSYKLADGSTAPSQTFVIRSLKVGDKVLENVTGSMAPIEGGLLLGQSFLSRFKSWSFDNQRQVLILD